MTMHVLDRPGIARRVSKTFAPIAAVAALRETSILFVMLMSAIILKEKVTGFRLAGATLIVLGAVALRLA